MATWCAGFKRSLEDTEDNTAAAKRPQGTCPLLPVACSLALSSAVRVCFKHALWFQAKRDLGTLLLAVACLLLHLWGDCWY